MELVKSVNELKKRRWYRLLRMCFVASFLTAQTIGILLVLSRTEGELVAPISFEWVGRALKKDLPAYRGMSEEQVGREVYRKDPALWAEYVEKYEKKHAINPLSMRRVYSDMQRVEICAIAFLLITVFFEVVRRSFYYVIFGKIFPRKKRRRRRQV